MQQRWREAWQAPRKGIAPQRRRPASAIADAGESLARQGDVEADDQATGKPPHEQILILAWRQVVILAERDAPPEHSEPLMGSGLA